MSTATDATLDTALVLAFLRGALRSHATPTYDQLVRELATYPGRCPRPTCAARPGKPCTTDDGQGGRRAMVVLHLERLEASRA